MSVVRIATRNSPLALWQANYAKDQLEKHHPGLEVEIVPMTTKGDQLLDRSLSKVGGKGLFLKELEVSLLNKETDIAVHSMKDVPVALPEGLEIAALFEREEPRDAFVSNHYQNLYALPKGAKVGTASLRRRSQLQNAFPSLEFVELRGNVNTRLAKLDAEEFDAIILAAAGLIRLDMEQRISQLISPELCLPAVGQGIVGIECRTDDARIKDLLEPLHDRKSELVLSAERSMNAKLDGGCQMPVAGFAEVSKGRLRLRGLVAKLDGSIVLRSESEVYSIAAMDPVTLGESVARDLQKQGAQDILDELKPEQKAVQVQSENKESTQQGAVLLTRQSKYLGNTVEILERLNYRSHHIPILEVEPVCDGQLELCLRHLAEFDDIIFVSRNAVEQGMPLIQEHGEFPENVRAIAVGRETAKQLFQYNIDALFPSVGTGAEALLNVSQLQNLQGRSVLVMRGEQGLDWPKYEMEKRGAEVKEGVCYRQKIPEESAHSLSKALSGEDRLEGIFVHSSNSLRNLMAIAAENTDKIRATTLVAGSDAIAKTAQEFDWQGEICIAESPSNKHMMIAFSKE